MSKDLTAIHHLSGDQFLQSFFPRRSCSHYRSLMSVEEPEARYFYEKEAKELNFYRPKLKLWANFLEALLRGLTFLSRWL